MRAQQPGASWPVGLPDDPLDPLTRLAAAVSLAPTALIALGRGEQQRVRSQLGLPASWTADAETPLARFRQHVAASGRPIVVPDARGGGPSGSARGDAEADGRIVAYLGTPLIAPDGEVRGEAGFGRS